MRRLLLFGLIVYCVILFRAGHQAVTLDEADAYFNFATGNLDMSFYPSSGNHVLNSLLTRYITQVFGLSPFTLRGAAVVGAAFYLIAAAFLAVRLAEGRWKIEWLGFAVLTVNPFVLDYLIASRGYALALGLLAAAVAFAFERRYVLFSICCGLALAANFSFAFAIVATGAAFLLTVRPPWKSWIGAIVPGVVVALALVGTTLRDYPKAQLYHGAETWTQTFAEMVDAVLPKENLTFPSVTPVLKAIHPFLPWLMLIPLGLAVLEVSSMRLVWVALTLTLAIHGAAHVFRNVLLPLDRTSLFLVFFVSVLSISAASRHRAAAAVLCLALCVFALAFRTNYFRIWAFDMDIDRGFAAFADYSKSQKIETAGCT